MAIPSVIQTSLELCLPSLGCPGAGLLGLCKQSQLRDRLSVAFQALLSKDPEPVKSPGQLCSNSRTRAFLSFESMDIHQVQPEFFSTALCFCPDSTEWGRVGWGGDLTRDSLLPFYRCLTTAKTPPLIISKGSSLGCFDSDFHHVVSPRIWVR